jgi:hypothetical protein
MTSVLCSGVHALLASRDTEASTLIVQPAPAGLIAHLAPGRPDNGQHDVAQGEALLQDVVEVLARPHAIDIDEDIASTEGALEVLSDAQRVRSAVVPAIVDEDLAHNRLVRRSALLCATLAQEMRRVMSNVSPASVSWRP